ncbi:hypothetical protein Q8A73_020753 [Channa argus]|nr:hypothetical protein Q8A73_020753 [Channa argus]
MAASTVITAMVSMLLSVMFVSGDRAACLRDSGLFITAPLNLEALSGSCLLIPCNFSVKLHEQFNSRTSIFGVWLKNDHLFHQKPNNVIYNSSKTVNTYPMSITGDLTQKNCTTLFSNLSTNYTEKYLFRIENGPVRAIAVCDVLHITIKDSAPSPIIKIPGDVKEKESVTITCSALTPCPHSPPKLTWTLQQDPHTNIVNTNGTFTTKIQETITLSDRHDGSTISCSATYPVNGGRDVRTAETQETLRVSYSPRDTAVEISPTGPVSVGKVVNLTCSCRANPPVLQFTWLMISDGRLQLLKAHAQIYSFKVTDRDRHRLFYCECRNDLGFELSKGCQLTFDGSHVSQLFTVPVLVKILEIAMLICTLIIFECCFRLRFSTKPVKVNVNIQRSELNPMNSQEVSRGKKQPA